MRSTISYSIGIVGSKVIMFALVPFYSFYLSREELGQYDLILVSITLFTPLVTIQISDAVYRFLLQATNEGEKKAYVTTGLFVILMGYMIFGTFALLLNFYVQYPLFTDFMALLFTSCLYLFTQQVIRGVRDNRIYAVMGTTNAILVGGLSCLFLLVFELNLRGIIWALVISQFASVALGFILKNLWALINWKALDGKIRRSLLHYSWPLLPNALSWWLIDLGNRYIILIFLGEAFNGIYAVGARFAGIMALINSIFILTWQDFAISDGNDTTADLKRASGIFRYFMIFELSTILVLSSGADYIIGFTTDANFHEAAKYFPILLLASGFSAFSAYLGALYLKEKKTKGLFVTSLLGGICNMVVSLALVNSLGLYGIAIGSLTGFIITFASRLVSYPIQVPRVILAMTIILFVFTIGLQFFDYQGAILINMIFMIFIFVLLNKPLFLSIKAKVLSDREGTDPER